MGLLLAISLLGNALAIVLVLWGWYAGRGIAERLYVAPNRERRRSFFDGHRVAPGDVVFVGDSLTAGAQWHEMFPSLPVKGRGIGGDTTATLLARLGQVTAGRPAVVLLMIGTNDLSTGVPHDRLVANYAAILDRLGRESPDSAVIVQSVLPRSAAFAERVRTLNAALGRLARERAATFVDLTPVFTGTNGAILPAYSNDDLHLLGPGYLAWQRVITPVVADALRARAPCEREIPRSPGAPALAAKPPD
jgi:lysophospholipase L1-like esterase